MTDQELNDRTPPANNEAEKSLLGALLLSRDAFAMTAHVTAQDFYSDRHKTIFEALLSIYRRNETSDLISLSHELETMGALERTGGRGYLIELTEATPTAANAGHYAKIVKSKAKGREVIELADKLKAAAYAGGVEPMIMDSARRLIEIGAGGKSSLQDGQTLFAGALNQIVTANKNHAENPDWLPGFRTGFYNIDSITLGFQPGQLFVIGARPSMGKSSIARDFAFGIAEHGVPVAYFSLEDSEEGIGTRAIASSTGINSQSLQRGRVDHHDMDRIVVALRPMANLPVWWDFSSFKIDDICNNMRRAAVNHGCRVAMIDYLGMIVGPKMATRDQEVGYITRALKQLAKDLKIAIILFSQLNRALENREDKRPNKADLRESGNIEQDADGIAFLHRPIVYFKPDELRSASLDQRQEAWFLIKKQRNGPLEDVKLRFFDNFSMFKDW